MKKITKKPNREKKLIRIFKKPISSVRFSFISLKLKKLNRTKKTEPNQKNRAKQKKPVFVLK